MGLFNKLFDKETDHANLTKEEYYFLRNISFLKKLHRLELKLFSKLLNKRVFQPGEYIFKQGYPVAVLYMIKEGKIEIVLEKKDNVVILTSLDKYCFFGEPALFVETQRTASARAAVKSTLYAVSKKDFQEFIATHPKIGGKILFELGKRLSQMVIDTNQRFWDAQSELEELHSARSAEPSDGEEDAKKQV
ncbi:MAG: cyclic nucleotide-binding domain-containing protein [Candidatus Cloacimonetes bacterium]|nr:cyclic nucleotide-binding domain-containing protein [Candidatus Cloacimonadota bacterium]